MTFFSVDNAKPLGAGQHSPAGSVDAELGALLARYKRNVASRYRALAPNEISSLINQRMLVSPKIDGETWFLIIEGTTVALASPRGRVISGPIPVLEEARRVASRISGGRAVYAGELFALRKGGRPRHGDLASAVARGEVERIGFTAFDRADVEFEDRSLAAYDARLAEMREVFDGGKRLRAINTEEINRPNEVETLYGEWVASEKAEGLVVRVDGRIFKVKPVMHVDAVVVAYTLRGDDPSLLRSVLLGLVREAGQLQIIGSCGNLGTEDNRRALAERLVAMDCEAAYRHASNDGALYQFVRPEIVFEIKLNDLQSEGSDGGALPRMVLHYGDEGYHATRKMPGVSMLGPTLSRVRDDKSADVHDTGLSQVMDRVLLTDATTHAEKLDLPEAEMLRREVWVKTTTEKLAVRKLLVWKTNKESVDPRYSAFVVHWTDYSPGRKEPLQRTVRLANSLEDAATIADEMIVDRIKRGWDRVA